MEGETISVIIPAYNVAPWLPRCLDSILAQTYSKLEIIVVDDGSADNTRQVMEDYAARDGRISPIFKENGGVTSARLAGVAAATGEWIGFADGDDAIDPDMYRHLLENAHTYDADISHCGHRVEFPDGRVAYVHNTGGLRQQDNLTGLRDLLDGGQVESGQRKLFENAAGPFLLGCDCRTVCIFQHGKLCGQRFALFRVGLPEKRFALDPAADIALRSCGVNAEGLTEARFLGVGAGQRYNGTAGAAGGIEGILRFSKEDPVENFKASRIAGTHAEQDKRLCRVTRFHKVKLFARHTEADEVFHLREKQILG